MTDEILLIEAALFSAGRPLTPDELAALTGTDVALVRKLLRMLKRSYATRRTAIEIAKLRNKYVMQLKPELLPKAERVVPGEIPKPTLKTAAMIAYYQPVRQKKLVDMLGTRVYDDVKLLDKLGLLTVKKVGRIITLKTSRKFADYFGIDVKRQADIKKWVAEKAGMVIPAEKSEPEQPATTCKEVTGLNRGESA